MSIKYTKEYFTEQLIKNVEDWGDSHDLHDPVMQYAKMNEEVGEIGHELTRDNMISPEGKDAIGDTIVTIIIFSHQLGYDFLECLQSAFNEIKDRKGKTIKGTFIKNIKK